jgi:hypothetical protein
MRNLLIAFSLLAGLSSAFGQGKADEKEWVQLFNGKDLTGWIPKITGYDTGVNYGNTFRVENGMMKVVYDPDKYPKWASQFGHIFYKDKFSYYLIAAEYRFVGEQVPGGPGWALRNSGIMIHCQDPKTMMREQDFPISIEVQLLGGDGKGPRPTANMCSPGTNVVIDGKLFTTHCLNSKSKTIDGDRWVRVEALVLGDSIVEHRVDGEKVMSYEMPQIGGGSVSNYDPKVKVDGKLLTEGWISLQSESHPVEFRKVELLNLAGCMDPKAKNYKTYFVKAENSQCQY